MNVVRTTSSCLLAPARAVDCSEPSPAQPCLIFAQNKVRGTGEGGLDAEVTC